MGGKKIIYPGDCGTPTFSLITVNLHQNSTISTKNAQYMTLDIKHFYLNTPMERYEYMRLKLADLPDDFIAYYNSRDKATPDGYVHVKIRRGMYGLPQSGKLAHELLE